MRSSPIGDCPIFPKLYLSLVRCVSPRKTIHNGVMAYIRCGSRKEFVICGEYSVFNEQLSHTELNCYHHAKEKNLYYTLLLSIVNQPPLLSHFFKTFSRIFRSFFPRWLTVLRGIWYTFSISLAVISFVR